ncbi:MAG: class I SAM-dependent rRNA methyltransferase [Elusimicrobia bacterium]|nr:class I SAM-dependent rRNA methyltransferase [Elusimicrobiota bacterium]
MPETESFVSVKLKPGQEDRLRAGHLWVFSNEIAGVEGPAEPGSLAQIFTAGGESLGLAFYHPNSLIAARLLTSKVEAIDAAFFHKRLAAALAYRQRACPGETSFRLAFGESDGLPGLVADRYGDTVVLQVFSAGMEARLPLIEAALKELLDPRGIFLKNDHRARQLEGLPGECRLLCGTVPERVAISEGGLRFWVPIGEGQKTGHYFDQRENRAFLRPWFKDRAVVDLYCYTGAFAVNAAKSGAKAVLAVDSSGPAVALAKENAKLNGVSEAMTCDEADAEAVLESFASGRQPFRPDLILLDPPSLVPSKKHLPKALRAYAKLNSLALKALAPGGVLATSTCSHHVDRESFVGMLRYAAGKARRAARLTALRGQAADHPVLLAMPETEYLHFALLEVL